MCPHTHTRARLSSAPAREVWLKLSCPPWCLQSSCQHPPADSPSPACEANAGTMNSLAQRGVRQSLQGAEAEAQACGQCGRRGCCGCAASVAGVAGWAQGPRASVSSLTTRAKAPTAPAPSGPYLRQRPGSRAHPRGCLSSFLDESISYGRHFQDSWRGRRGELQPGIFRNLLPRVCAGPSSTVRLCLALSAVGAWGREGRNGPRMWSPSASAPSWESLVRPRGLAQTQQIPESWIISENPKGGQCDLSGSPNRAPALIPHGGQGGAERGKVKQTCSLICQKTYSRGWLLESSPRPNPAKSSPHGLLGTTCKFSLQAAIPRTQPQSLGPAPCSYPCRDQASPLASDTALRIVLSRDLSLGRAPRLVPLSGPASPAQASGKRG